MAINTRDNIVDSEWFRRGWTLQELIAPHDVHFFDRDWHHYGDKIWYSSAISQKHRIPMEVLYGDEPRKYSVAQRMSWANGRQTTKVEDRAYSLLGIFDVNMPMLYGEGGGAFIRLQGEINKLSPQMVERKPSKTTLNYARPQYMTRDTQTDELGESRSEPWEHVWDLGRGKCATVSVVREISTCDAYACKSVPFSIKIDDEYDGMPSRPIPAKVHDEVKLMQKLRHKHIASVLMLFRWKTTWNMMMLPIADLNMDIFLANCIADGYPRERLRLLDSWFGCLITALSFAHSEGIKNGNIKPTNILIKDNTVYLTDFGSLYSEMAT